MIKLWQYYYVKEGRSLAKHNRTHNPIIISLLNFDSKKTQKSQAESFLYTLCCICVLWCCVLFVVIFLFLCLFSNFSFQLQVLLCNLVLSMLEADRWTCRPCRRGRVSCWRSRRRRRTSARLDCAHSTSTRHVFAKSHVVRREFLARNWPPSRRRVPPTPRRDRRHGFLPQRNRQHVSHVDRCTARPLKNKGENRWILVFSRGIIRSRIDNTDIKPDGARWNKIDKYSK